REGDVGIWDQRADGTGGAEHLTIPVAGTLHRPESWSPDGETISFSVQKPNTSEVWTYSMREKKLRVYAPEPGAEFGSSMFFTGWSLGRVSLRYSRRQPDLRSVISAIRFSVRRATRR